MKTKKDYIANGRLFSSLDEVQKYAENEKMFIESTEKIKGKNLVHLRIIPTKNPFDVGPLKWK